MLENLLKPTMKLMVDLVGLSTTEMVKGSKSLPIVLIRLLKTLFSRRTTKINYF